MNRRKFIASGVMSASLLSVFPSFALSKSTTINLSDVGEGFKVLSAQGQSRSIFNLSENIKKTYQRLTNALEVSGYNYDTNSVFQLNKNVYAVPLSKKRIFEEGAKEMALIIKGDYSSKYYILNEQLTSEFNLLISNFNEHMSYHTKDISTSDFALPVKVIKQTSGVKNTFVYKNKFNTTIALHSEKSKSKAIIG